jgi:outer membrane protein
MKRQTFLFFLGGIFLGGILLFCINFFFNSGDNTRYVSMSLVFEESKISEKYKKDLKEIEDKSNAALAQFENEIRALKQTGGNAQQIAGMEKELLVMRDKLTDEYQQKSATFERVIWEKINQKVNEYGKEQGYDYIFGAKGDGSIMYASDHKDITKEIIAYINQ